MLTFSVILRLVLSTTIVVGGLLAVRWWSSRAGGKARGAIRVVARAGIARSSSVAVVEVANRRYLVGAGEHSVNLIAELDGDVDLETAMAGGSGAGTESLETQPANAEGLAFRTPERDWPRTGLVAHLRQMTTRVPREVRIHGNDS